MSLPKTIVLTAIPNKLPLNRSNMDSLLRSNGGCQMSVLHLKKEVSSSEDDISPAPIRKRQKLDHLSSEEKIQRRKLKNRVAAQCARDRKKARMSSLEDQVAVLELEKKTLLKENFILKQRNQQLEKENQKLKNQRLQQQPEQPDEKPLQSEQTTVLHVKTEEDSIKFLGHAAGAGTSTVYSLDDAIRLFADDCEPDDILELLQQCSEELLQDTIVPSSSTDRTDTEENTGNKSKDKMVGTTSENLESIKELIEFDHVYYKHDDDMISTSNQQVISTENTMDESICLPSENDCISLLSKDTIHENQRDQDEFDSNLLIPDIIIKREYDDIPDPVSPLNSLDVPSSLSPSPYSNESGYDSVNSPLSETGNFLDDPWGDTLTELFPSLI